MLSSCAQSGVALLNSTAKTNDYIKITDRVYGTQARNTLDVYHPKGITATKKPVIVFFYGGCWGECNPLQKKDYLFVAQSLASRGYITVIPDYREYPEVNFSTLMSDASNAMHWVSQQISEYGGDPTRVFVAGHSSGAHIAAMLAMNPNYLNASIRKNIRGFIGLAGPYDFLPLDEAYQHKLFAPQEQYAASQPINFVSSQSPPLLLLHGERDTTVKPNNSRSLARKAQSLGDNHRLVLYPKLDHVGILLALSRPLQARSSVLKDMLGFLKQHQ